MKSKKEFKENVDKYDDILLELLIDIRDILNTRLK